MELTAEQMEAIQAASRRIEFGRITVNLTGKPHYLVDIIAEEHLRFHSERSQATQGQPIDTRRSGRYGRD
jgi:hypothetical protein